MSQVFIKQFQMIGKGAEAELWSGSMLGIDVVLKKRISKAYRNPVLDARLRASRTFEEGRLLSKAYLSGVSVPAPVFIDPLQYVLVESLVRGVLLRDYEKAETVMRSLGMEVGKLHQLGIVHGDLTTSNVMVGEGGRVYIIDLGLGSFSNDVEDRGVDILLMKKSLEANTPSRAAALYEEFVAGYREVFGPGSEDVLVRAQEIERRGRYFEERAIDRWRSSW